MKTIVITILLATSFAFDIHAFNSTTSSQIEAPDQQRELIVDVQIQSFLFLSIDNHHAVAEHATLMMLSWSYLSIIQVFLNRFMKHYWRWHYFVHSCVGLAMTLMTCLAFMIMLQKNEYTFPVEAHTIFGAATLTGITMLFVTGSVAIISRK